MTRPPALHERIAVVGGAGLLAFFLLAGAIRSGAALLGAGPLVAHAVLKLAVIVLSLAVARVAAARGATSSAQAWRATWERLGLGRTSLRSTRRWPWYLLTALAMGGATSVMVCTGARHPLTVGLTLPQIVVSVWLLSSVAEELFVRGLLQRLMAGSNDAALGARPVVAASATFFAALHVPLLWSGAGLVGGGAIVAATFVVGWAAAELRGRTGGLLQPILVHVFGNAISLPFGAATVVLYRVVVGHLPPGVG